MSNYPVRAKQALTYHGDLKGRRAISYFRFSALNSGHGSTIQRQQRTLDRVLAETGMILDEQFTDSGRSAYKGVHRKRGKLALIIERCEAGEIKPGTVLIVEAIDRLVREPMTISLDLIMRLIRDYGIIIVTGNDRNVWCEISINSHQNIALVASINQAYEEVKRLTEKCNGACQAARDKLRAFEQGESKNLPILKAPSWLLREGKRENPSSIRYVKIPDNVRTVRKVYDMCQQGWSCAAIAGWLNGHRDEYPLFGQTAQTEWQTGRIDRMLSDERVLGVHQAKLPPEEAGKYWCKNRPIDSRANIYPQIISHAIWVRTRKILKSRSYDRAPKGKLVANLFVGHVFCQCGSRMEIQTHSQKCNGYHSLECAAHRHSGDAVCAINTLYPLRYYEPLLLMALCALSTLVPRGKKNDPVRALQEELSHFQVKITRHAKSSNALAQGEVDDETAIQIKTLNRQVADYKTKASNLENEIIAITAPGNRHQEIWEFIRSHVQKAMTGNVAIREQVRKLLMGIEYRIEGCPQGGLMLTVGDHEEHIGGVDARMFRLDRVSEAWPAKGTKRMLRGEMMTYSGIGWWKTSDGKAVRMLLSEADPTRKANGMTVPNATIIHDGKPAYYRAGGWWSYVPPSQIMTQIAQVKR